MQEEVSNEKVLLHEGETSLDMYALMHKEASNGITVEEVTKRVGGFGRFQILSCALLIVEYSIALIFWNAVTLEELVPNFLCQ